MAIPSKATGYGNNSTARNVFRLAFSTALSGAPLYKAWDGAVFPATGVAVTTANTVFAGTAGNGNKPMLSLVDTSSGAPALAWKPAAATAGSANPNRMKGSTNFVTATATPGAGGTITWNEVIELPSDATTSSTMATDLEITYQYTGVAPVLTWAYNEGTEGVPIWTALVPGTNGLRHCDAGTVSPVYLLTIPSAGTVDSAEGWITT
jgi:hypothetical protein